MILRIRLSQGKDAKVAPCLEIVDKSGSHAVIGTMSTHLGWPVPSKLCIRFEATISKFATLLEFKVKSASTAVKGKVYT